MTDHLAQSGGCPHCPDGHRKPGSKPMSVWVGPERDHDGQPTTLHVAYAAGHHVSEAEAAWLRRLLAFVGRTQGLVAEHADIIDALGRDDV